MKKITWDDVTVSQFIQLKQIGEQKEIDEMTKAEETIKILFEITSMEMDDLPLPIFNEYSKSCAEILTTHLESNVKPKKVIEGKNKKYAVVYDPTKLTHRQFVEIQFFSNDMINNIHNIMASLVQPIGRFGRRLKNTAEQHAAIAEDLLDAKIVDVYRSCVFFCKLYLNSLQSIKGYLVEQMMKTGATKNQALVLLDNSIDAMAGSIIQEKWQLSKELHSTKHGSSQYDKH